VNTLHGLRLFVSEGLVNNVLICIVRGPQGSEISDDTKAASRFENATVTGGAAHNFASTYWFLGWGGCSASNPWASVWRINLDDPPEEKQAFIL
jgi:hypothetical protein